MSMPLSANKALDGLFYKNLLFEFTLSPANAGALPKGEPLCGFNASYDYLLQKFLPTSNNSKYQLTKASTLGGGGTAGDGEGCLRKVIS